jgi:hypothetical protein
VGKDSLYQYEPFGTKKVPKDGIPEKTTVYIILAESIDGTYIDAVFLDYTKAKRYQRRMNKNVDQSVCTYTIQNWETED